MKPFRHFLEASFNCDRCKRDFEASTAYSVAENWEELKTQRIPTFCFNCVRIVEEEERLKTPPKLDKRTLNKTGRTHQLATRVRKDFLKKLKKLSRKEKLKYVEVLERALDCYEKKVSRKRVVG